MNVLLIIFGVMLFWRISVGMKKGIVREIFSFITVLFASLFVGMAAMMVSAYHEKEFLSILLILVGVTILSIIYSMIKLVFFPAKVVTKLPVISSVDKIAGIVTGIVETLLVYWGMCYALIYLELGMLKEQILMMVAENTILQTLYEYNVLGLLLENVKSKFL